MLKISISETDSQLTLKLDGRIAGLWVEELERVWAGSPIRLGNRKFVLDLREVTYASATGIATLREIYEASHPEVLTGSPGSQALAEEMMSVDSSQPGIEGHHDVETEFDRKQARNGIA